MNKKTNEYGWALDRNGYSGSLLFGHGEYYCYLCKENKPTERHEAFGGAYRQKSKALGLWVNLCESCHRTGKDAAHRSGETACRLKADAQTAAWQFLGMDEVQFRERFGKSYL